MGPYPDDESGNESRRRSRRRRTNDEDVLPSIVRQGESDTEVEDKGAPHGPADRAEPGPDIRAEAGIEDRPGYATRKARASNRSGSSECRSQRWVVMALETRPILIHVAARGDILGHTRHEQT